MYSIRTILNLCRYCYCILLEISLDKSQLYCRCKTVDDRPCFLYTRAFKMKNDNSHSFKFLVGSRYTTKFLLLYTLQNPRRGYFIAFCDAVDICKMHITEGGVISCHTCFKFVSSDDIFSSSMIDEIRSNKSMCIFYVPFVEHLFNEIPSYTLVFYNRHRITQRQAFN